MGKISRYKVRVDFEASIIVEFDVSKNKHLSNEDIFNLARIKATMANQNEFAIGDEISQEILSKIEVDNGEPIEKMLDDLGLSSRNENNEDDNDEVEAEDLADGLDNNFAQEL